MGTASRSVLRIEIARDDDRIVVSSQEASIHFESPDYMLFDASISEFALWLFLPIAMRTNKDLYINGVGSKRASDNARKMAEVWSSWLPEHFNSINVRFAVERSGQPTAQRKDALVLYSGGIDSTFCLLKRISQRENQFLLTIHGMDYKYDDIDKFTKLLSKTRQFADSVSRRRLTVKTNAYSVYRRYSVNYNGDIGHAFVLAAACFLFSETFRSAHIAADYRLDQQYLTHPWGTNNATNRLFESDHFRLVTENQDTTRAEKTTLLMDHPACLTALAFCTDYSFRPENCGACQKCLRTKAMFLVGTGAIPPIFCERSLPSDWWMAFDIFSKSQLAFLLDIYTVAQRNDRLHLVSGIEEAVRRVIRYRRAGSIGKLTMRHIWRVIPGSR